jgi:Xaa-Pro aminopeptidase
MKVFSDTEMAGRHERLRKELAARNVDVALLHTADNVFYISGVPLLSEWGRPMWAVVTKGEASAVCGAAIELENMQDHSTLAEVLWYGDDASVIDASLRLCVSFMARQGKGKLRIGIEEELMPLGIYRALQAAFEGAEFVEIGDVLSAMRLIKSREEIALLELGGALAKIGADEFLNALAENVTELTVAARAVEAVNSALGALSLNGLTSTYAYAQFGSHTLTPHLHPTSRRLKRGDLVALNVFPVVWGYCAELERTFVFGEANEAQAHPLEAVTDAYYVGVDALRPGAPMREVDRATREVLQRYGLSEHIRHGTGHAHGIMIGSAGREEKGELRSYNPTPLQENMANSVEPGVYLPEVGGFRHSDVYILTGDGARCITEFPVRIGF